MNQTVLESKKGVVSEISEKFTNSSSTVVAEYRGLSVAEVTELRRALRAEGAEMKVYKNTLASKQMTRILLERNIKRILHQPAPIGK